MDSGSPVGQRRGMVRVAKRGKRRKRGRIRWLAVVLLVLAAGSQLRAAPGFLGRWDRWDVGLFRKVAQYGYAGYPAHYPDRGVEAFFPGLPLVLAAVHAVVPSWTAAGLLISLASGAVASVALSRLAALDGVEDPERKRKAIGHTFIDVFEDAAQHVGDDVRFLVQGTLYPDVIESASPSGGPSVTIKTHHNVGGLKADMKFALIEPPKRGGAAG